MTITHSWILLRRNTHTIMGDNRYRTTNLDDNYRDSPGYRNSPGYTENYSKTVKRWFKIILRCFVLFSPFLHRKILSNFWTFKKAQQEPSRIWQIQQLPWRRNQKTTVGRKSRLWNKCWSVRCKPGYFRQTSSEIHFFQSLPAVLVDDYEHFHTLRFHSSSYSSGVNV